MVIPSPLTLISSALGIGDLRSALAFMQRSTLDPLGGLGFSRRQIALQIGVNESTLRGIERLGSSPQRATVDSTINAIRSLDLFTIRSGQERTNVETLVGPDLSPGWYTPQPPTGVTAFRLVVVAGDDKPYAYETLLPKSLGSFNIRDEIARATADGRRVTRVIWDKTVGAGNRIATVQPTA